MPVYGPAGHNADELVSHEAPPADPGVGTPEREALYLEHLLTRKSTDDVVAEKA
ncbi:hypothetical protein ACFQZ4_06325 [Catellatospora coxensis]|uniref:Uncharacterized protein n=1 Tax=Catellatospora coxensis TaxID=310354 RepID=A0A8J3P626_9ACTN|nr:hypothetical protein Cco03nite_20260 [Catellatospora coxensis]